MAEVRFSHREQKERTAESYGFLAIRCVLLYDGLRLARQKIRQEVFHNLKEPRDEPRIPM